MRTAIISDVHANQEALEAVMQRIDREQVDRTICLGDVVGYGDSPDECCRMLMDRRVMSLLGNHDAAVTGAMDEAYYYEGARRALQWTRDRLSDASYKWLYALPFTRVEDDVAFFHSAPILPSGYFYVVQASEAQTHAQVLDRLRPLSFIGHAHLTVAFQIGEKKVKSVEAKQIKPKADSRFIINVGSVGQPRDRDPRACFTIWDSDKQVLTFVRVEYDIESAAAKIVSAGLDEKFAKRLFLGV
jgi:diadenosine tetraphosphatase ApaH/serine/threonine PP2A family protein phosphatase